MINPLFEGFPYSYALNLNYFYNSKVMDLELRKLWNICVVVIFVCPVIRSRKYGKNNTRETVKVFFLFLRDARALIISSGSSSLDMCVCVCPSISAISTSFLSLPLVASLRTSRSENPGLPFFLPSFLNPTPFFSHSVWPPYQHKSALREHTDGWWNNYNIHMEYRSSLSRGNWRPQEEAIVCVCVCVCVWVCVKQT